MGTYARISNGVVVEIILPVAYREDGPLNNAGIAAWRAGDEIPIADRFHPDLVATMADISSISPQPQPRWIATEIDGTWAFGAPVEPPLTDAEKARALLQGGLTVISIGTPELNGTFACDALSQSDIIAIETSLNAGKGFPGGASAFNYPDMSGVMHAFNEVNFANLAAAVRDFVYACRAVIAGSSKTLPASTASIA